MDQRSFVNKIILQLAALTLLLAFCSCTHQVTDFSVVPRITKDEYMRLDSSSITLNEYMDIKTSKPQYSKHQLEIYFSCELLLSHAYSHREQSKDSESLTEKCNKVALGSDAALLDWLRKYSKKVPLQKNTAF